MEDSIENSLQVSPDVNNPSIPRLYTNWVVGGHSFSDVFLLLSTNGNPTLVVNMPPMIAKKLHSLLGDIITGYEAKIGEIKTIEDAKL